MTDTPIRLLRIINLPFVIAHVLTVSVLFSSPSQEKPRYIRKVSISRHDVFPEINSRPRFLYEWANSLHIVTKERIIRQELLFKSGDVFDPELLEESERKLRALAYFGAAEISVAREEGQYVDISVVTQDQWSTLLSGIIQQGGGRTILGGAVEEFNFLGYGKQIFTEIRHERREGTQLTLRYTDPQVAGSRWTTEQTLIRGPFVKSYTARVARPFYSLDTKWAGGITAIISEDINRQFDRNVEFNRFRFESKGFQVFGARAFGHRFNKIKTQLSYRALERDFSPIDELTTAPLADDELIHSMALAMSFENLSFVEENRLDKFVRTEDLTLGNTTIVSLGRTGIPFPKGVKRFQCLVRRQEAHEIFEKQYLFALLGFQTLFERDTIVSLRLKYYNKLLAQQTIAFNFEFDYTQDLEAGRQFLLGGDSGLRGYAAREFGGVHRLLLNLEDRIFTPLNILTVALGGVVFLDAGNVWQDGETITLRDLNYSVGFGLRLGYTKSPRSRVGRIDFGWPLNRGGGFGVFVGVDQQFSIN
ncbi:BamA/TamA family outer membrane protein [bacterium]|nr:BamA/TamA family outer membrane protein [bacterium]